MRQLLVVCVSGEFCGAMSVFRSGLKVVSAARGGLRAAPALSVAVRHGGGGRKPVSNIIEPNGFLFNEKVKFTIFW